MSVRLNVEPQRTGRHADEQPNDEAYVREAALIEVTPGRLRMKLPLHKRKSLVLLHPVSFYSGSFV